MNARIALYFSTFTAIATLGILSSAGAYAQGSYRYAESPLFHPQPRPTDGKPWNVKNLGPVGIGIDLVPPSMQMVIGNVEPGSPADKVGKLKTGQIIESINGKVLMDIDPRIILGNIITEAEATDGKVSLKIQGAGDVVVTIPVMGAYSPTWPINCKKSDKIVRGMADLLAKQEKPSMGSVLFLLSTGEEKDLAVVRRWMKDLDSTGATQWQRGFIGPGVCEYYLRTGDKGVLPAIRKSVEDLEKNMFNGAWSGRGGPASFTYSTGSGALNAAGIHCMTFLLLAKMCGVEVDEYTLQESLKQFYRFAGHGNVAYGEGFPEGGYTDNGKTSGLALAMAAATLLTPNGESSIYAKARDHTAIKAFYASNFFHAAHTGGGLGEIWHHAAMNLLFEKRPLQFRSYYDTRRWVMELSRRFDGSIGIGGMTDRYDVSVTDHGKDNIDFGTYFALTYTLHRKQLQLFGAPRSKYAKYHQLPERPWGNASDDIFVSNDPPPNPFIGSKNLLNEKIETDSSFRIFQRSASNENELMRNLYHPELGLREDAIRLAIANGRHECIIPLLESKDARMRHLGTSALSGMFKGTPIPPENITPEMSGLLGKMIEDPNESWWVVQEAILALSRTEVEAIAKHKARLLDLLEKRPCNWTKTNSLIALAKLCADPKHYKDTLKPTMMAYTKVWTNAASYRFNRALREAMLKAPDEVKAYASPILQEAYSSIPPELVAKGGAVYKNGSETLKGRMGPVMALLPGAGTFINKIPKTTLAYVKSGDPKDKFEFKEFKPDPRFAGRWKEIGKCYSRPPSEKDILNTIKNYDKRRAIAESKNNKKGLREDFMLLWDGKGKAPKGQSFWSEKYLINNTSAEALEMFVKTVEGKQCLLVQIGGFPEETSPDYTVGHMLYVKE